jgi:hypothetical protein
MHVQENQEEMVLKDISVFWYPRVDIYQIILYFRLHYKMKQLA